MEDYFVLIDSDEPDLLPWLIQHKHALEESGELTGGLAPQVHLSVAATGTTTTHLVGHSRELILSDLVFHVEKKTTTISRPVEDDQQQHGAADDQQQEQQQQQQQEQVVVAYKEAMFVAAPIRRITLRHRVKTISAPAGAAGTATKKARRKSTAAVATTVDPIPPTSSSSAVAVTDAHDAHDVLQDAQGQGQM